MSGTINDPARPAVLSFRDAVIQLGGDPDALAERLRDFTEDLSRADRDLMAAAILLCACPSAELGIEDEPDA